MVAVACVVVGGVHGGCLGVPLLHGEVAWGRGPRGSKVFTTMRANFPSSTAALCEQSTRGLKRLQLRLGHAVQSKHGDENEVK